MDKKARRFFSSASFALAGGCFFLVQTGFAQALTASSTAGVTDDQVDIQVRQKQQRIQDIQAALQHNEAAQQRTEQAALSLKTALDVLNNQLEDKRLTEDQAEQRSAILSLESARLQTQIGQARSVLTRRTALVQDLLRRIHAADRITPWDAFLIHPSLSDFFVQAEEVHELNQRLADAAREAHEARQDLERKQRLIADEQQDLERRQSELKQAQASLLVTLEAKQSLLAETQNDQARFERLIEELRAEQQTQASAIRDLQTRLKTGLDQADPALADGQTLFAWPIVAKQGISAGFHDPNYPFRRLFEHPGIDLPTDVGTPVHAAAGGYVAWTRTGKQYGNYIMVIHANGLASIYAHLSRFAVEPDTYVERGDVIGYSGGRPGDEGAGLSTGAHLHFEVRQNGIPVNPENFLPALTNGE